MTKQFEGFDRLTYTQNPNVFYDVLMRDMGEAELKVTLCIIRKTCGFHKDRDQITYAQLEDMTGLSRPSVRAGLKAGIDRGTIDREKKGRSYVYRLQFKAGSEEKEQLSSLTDPDDEQLTSLTENGQRSVKEVNTQKKILPTKENKSSVPDGTGAVDFDDNGPPPASLFSRRHQITLANAPSPDTDSKPEGEPEPKPPPEPKPKPPRDLFFEYLCERQEGRPYADTTASARGFARKQHKILRDDLGAAVPDHTELKTFDQYWLAQGLSLIKNPATLVVELVAWREAGRPSRAGAATPGVVGQSNVPGFHPDDVVI